LLLAYVVQLRAVVKATSMANVAAELVRLEEEGVRKVPTRTVFRLYLWWPGLGVMSLAYLLPLYAEATCFKALAKDHTERGDVAFVVVGLAVATIGVILPLLVRVYRDTIEAQSVFVAAAEKFRNRDQDSN
jgi:hypothetical protein